jgi:hypothetical protein
MWPQNLPLSKNIYGNLINLLHMKLKRTPKIPKDLKMIQVRCVLFRSYIKNTDLHNKFTNFPGYSCGFVKKPSSDIFQYQEPSSEN